MNRFSDWLCGLLEITVNASLFRKTEQQGTNSEVGFPEFFHELRTRELKKVPNEGETVLSAGCAGAWYFDWFRQSYAGTVRRHIGVDAYSPRPAGLPAEAVWVANSIQDMNAVRDGEVDLLFAGQMVEHLWPPEFAGLLSEAHRVLRPRGRLVMDSPNRDITTPLRWSHPEHTIEYTTREILEILKLAAFDVVSIRGLWLCRLNSQLIPLFSPEDSIQRRRRIIEANQRPEDSFSWWVEAVRAAGPPKRGELASRLSTICTLNRPQQFRGFRRQVGKVTETEAVKRVVTKQGESGFIHYGPYLPFPPGRHEITFALSTPQPMSSGATACVLDVTHDSGGTLLANREIRCCDLDRSTKDWQVLLDLGATHFGVEYRVRTTGALPVTLELPIKVRTISSEVIEPTEWTPLEVHELHVNSIVARFPHLIPISAETPHNIGSFDQKLGAMVARKNDTGALVFGPYLELEQGQYQVTFSVSTDGGQDEIIGKVDVNAFSDARPDNPVVEKELRRAKKDQNITLDFSGVPGKKYEFRVWANGNGSLSVKNITLDRKT